MSLHNLNPAPPLDDDSGGTGGNGIAAGGAPLSSQGNGLSSSTGNSGATPNQNQNQKQAKNSLGSLFGNNSQTPSNQNQGNNPIGTQNQGSNNGNTSNSSNSNGNQTGGMPTNSSSSVTSGSASAANSQTTSSNQTGSNNGASANASASNGTASASAQTGATNNQNSSKGVNQMGGLNNFNPNPQGQDDDDDDDDSANGGGGGGFPFSPDFLGGNAQIDAKDYLINYNEKYKDAPPALFRDEVIQQTLSCLIGMTKPNALLIGPAGVGKTKVAEEIARRIANQDPSIPDMLRNYIVYELPISNIVAGSGIVGDIEKKTKAVIEFAADPNEHAILFIDEIHMVADTHDSTYSKIAQILKPALARADMKVIGSTTSQEANDLRKDPAFNRRFTRIIVDELSQEQTKTILQNLSVKFFNHYCDMIAIDDKVIADVVQTADANRTMTSHRPDNAITLLDRSMADMFIDVKARIAYNEVNDPDIANAIKAALPMRLSCSQMQKTAMKLLTGNNKKSIATPEQLKEGFKAVKGQKDIIKELIDYINRDNLQVFPRKKPLSFLFAGSSGVGKSEVAKCLAKTLTGLPPICLNMAEFDSNIAITRIIGSSDGYVGSDSKKELPFDILETNPYQVILLDEFEKAHECVQQLFMSALDEGYITTSQNKVVDFSRSIIIATTNAGYDADDRSVNMIQDGTENDATTDQLSESIKPEIVNRFVKIFTFHPISRKTFAKILVNKYRTEVQRIKSIKSAYAFMADDIPKDDLDTMVEKNYDSLLGARHTFDIVKAYIEDSIIKHMPATSDADANLGTDSNDKPCAIVIDDDDDDDDIETTDESLNE